MTSPVPRSPVRRVIADVAMADPAADRGFWTDLLGLDTPMDQGWVVNHSATGVAQIPQVQLLTHDRTAPEDPALSVAVEPAEHEPLYRRMIDAGLEIVYPMTTEPWGVRRFFVRTPGGVVVNILEHHDA